ncbi:NUC121 domain-containing protein [Blastocladiella britannica]|nr:NUC121 domain-containing protein [Blastocladiella britannica]
MSSHHHRSTLSQSNKPFKGSGGASKRTLKNKAKGKIESVSDSHQKPAAGGPRTGIKSTVMSAQEARKNRTNAAKLAVKAKRDDHAAVQRFYCGRNAPAKVVAVIPLCTDYDPHATFAALYAAMDAEYAPSDAPSIVMPTRFKQQRLQFLKPARELLAVLDAVKLADYCLFVLSAKVEVDPFGEVLLTSILSQGLPSTVSVVQHLEAVAPTLKRQSEIRKSLLSYMSFWSPATEKVFTLGSSAECTNIVRTITDRNPKHVSWRDQYPYMIPDAVVPSPAVSGEEDKVDLAVTGHIRGNRFTANRLVHIPGFGDFQVSSVVSASLSAADQGMDTSGELLDTPDEDADDLVALNEMDDLMNEQTWPTEQELALGAGTRYFISYILDRS